jgi:hypothetical protein
MVSGRLVLGGILETESEFQSSLCSDCVRYATWGERSFSIEV